MHSYTERERRYLPPEFASHVIGGLKNYTRTNEVINSYRVATENIVIE